MRGDVPAAALRLCAQLPVRTHERPPPPPKAQFNGNRYGRRPVIIKGVEYATIRDARNKLGIGYEAFYGMIDSGEAKYL